MSVQQDLAQIKPLPPVPIAPVDAIDSSANTSIAQQGQTNIVSTNKYENNENSSQSAVCKDNSSFKTVNGQNLDTSWDTSISLTTPENPNANENGKKEITSNVTRISNADNYITNKNNISGFNLTNTKTTSNRTSANYSYNYVAIPKSSDMIVEMSNSNAIANDAQNNGYTGNETGNIVIGPNTNCNINANTKNANTNKNRSNINNINGNPNDTNTDNSVMARGHSNSNSSNSSNNSNNSNSCGITMENKTDRNYNDSDDESNSDESVSSDSMSESQSVDSNELGLNLESNSKLLSKDECKTNFFTSKSGYFPPNLCRATRYGNSKQTYDQHQKQREREREREKEKVKTKMNQSESKTNQNNSQGDSVKKILQQKNETANTNKQNTQKNNTNPTHNI